MTRREFERMIEDAIIALPETIRRRLENVGFVIEMEPPSEPDGGAAVMRGDELLGLYEGVALTDREFDYVGPPDKISIYMGPHLRMAEEDGEDVGDIVRDTVWHEIGHHLGFDDDEISRLEAKWGRRRSRTARNNASSCTGRV